MSKSKPSNIRSVQDEALLAAKLDSLAILRERIANATRVEVDRPAVGHIADLVEARPLLHVAMQAHLIEPEVERGASLIFWGSEDGLGFCLTLPYLGVKSFSTAGSFQEALDMAEAILGDPNHKWKTDRPRKRPTNPYGKAKGRST